MSFVDKLLPKEKPAEYFLTLNLGLTLLEALIWEVQDGKIVILGRGEEKIVDITTILEIADKALSAAEKNLPEGTLVEKVIFGLPFEYIDDDKIKPEILSHLKSVTNKLHLTPLGFIELPEAIAHTLKSKDSSPTSAILLGITEKSLTSSFLRVGKIQQNILTARTESIAEDFETSFKQFTQSDILPSRILLYGEAVDLEKIQESLMKFPWQTKSSFLHVPKIEIISHDDILHALVESAAHEIITTVEPADFVQSTQTLPAELPIVDAADTEIPDPTEAVEPPIKESKSLHLKNNEIVMEEDEAESLGFLKDKDVNEEPPPVALETRPEESVKTPEVPQAQEVDSLPHDEVPKRRINLPHVAIPLHLPAMPFGKLHVPNFGKLSILPIVLVLLALGLIGGGGVWAYYQIPHAEVKILVGTQNMQKDIDITLSPNASTVNTDTPEIPAATVETEVTGDAQAATTGKKTIGNPAKGTVTLYNKTEDSKKFPSGTVLTANNLKFTLESDVNIASASDTGEGMTYGKSDVKISAASIGTEGNMPGGTTFTFADFPSSSYTAKNNDALTGGTSKQVQAVSKSDQEKLLASLSDDLKNKAKSSLFEKISSDEKILDESIDVQIKNKKFDKAVDSEGKNVGLSLTVKITALSYKLSDFNSIVKNTVVSNLPAGFEFSEDRTNLKVNTIKKQKDGSLVAGTTVSAGLMPKFALDDIRNSLTGKSVSDAQNILKKINNVAGAEFNISTPLPFGKKTLPLKPGNITLSVSSN